MIVVSIATLGGVIRFMIAMEELLWLDELHTSWAVSATFGEVANRAADGNQAPLFFWSTWIPVQLLGESEFSVRAVSWLAGFGLMLVSAWLVWKWTCSSIAATVVVTAMAINTQFVFYATEARPYALLQLLSVIQVAVFWRLIDQVIAIESTEPNRKRKQFSPAWTLAIVSALLVYIHFTAVWLFVVELSFLPLLFVVAGRSKSSAGNSQFWELAARLIATAGVSVLACIPAFIQMLSVFQRRGNWAPVSSAANLLRDQWETFVLSMGVPLICLAVFLSVEYWFRRNEEGKDSDSIPASKWRSRYPAKILNPAFVMLWAIVPTICVVLVDAFDMAPVALARYTLVGSAAFPIFAGFVVAFVTTVPKRLAIGILIAGSAFWQNPIINVGLKNRELPVLRVENWKSPIDAINVDASKSSHPVFLFSNLIEDVDAIQNQDPRFQRYLLFPIRGLYEVETSGRELIPRPTLPIDHFAQADVAKIKQQGGAWVMVRGNPETLNEIADQLRSRMANLLGDDVEDIKMNLLESTGSPVYLFSVDW